MQPNIQQSMKKLLLASTSTVYGGTYLSYLRDELSNFFQKLNLKCKTTKNNVISSYKEDYFFDRKIREDRVLDDLDRLFQN